MGLFDWITGGQKAPEGVERRAEADLRAALLGVDRETA